MRKLLAPALAAAAALTTLAGCSESASDYGAEMAEYDVAEPAMEEAAMAADAAADVAPEGGSSEMAVAPLPESAPKIAYVYEYGFRLPVDGISAVQQRHADLCESKGPQVCRIIEMRQTGAEGDYGYAYLQLAVAASKARDFGRELAAQVESADGEQVSSAITGEDLSKQIVDVEARLRARTVLRDRLMEVLQNRKGSVGELVEAERGVAQVNEEIDQARSWLAEMRGRVDYSRVNIQYNSSSPNSGGFFGPIREAVGSVGGILGMVIAALIMIVTGLVPIALLVGAGVWSVRGWRKRHEAATEEPEGDAAQ